MGRKGRCGRKKALSEAGTRRVLAKLVLGERYRATYQSVGDELGVSYATVFAARWGNEKEVRVMEGWSTKRLEGVADG